MPIATNMGAGFTPGPWGICPETNGTEFVAYSGDPWSIRAILIRGDFISCNPNWKADTSLMAAAPMLYRELEAAGAIFRAYEVLHLEKGTDDGNAKAKRNGAFADVIERTLAKASGQ